MSRDHFFRRGDTYDRIADLASAEAWVVYVGLGATIDQTDLSWEGLVKRVLLHESEAVDEADRPTSSDIDLWVRQQGPQRAATTAEVLLRKRRGKRWLHSLSEQIEDLLYGPRELMAGSMIDSLALWATTVTQKGGSVLFVTPNYDDYLYREISSLEAFTDINVNAVCVLNSRSSRNRVPSNWKRPGTLSCVHLHGYVPKSPAPTVGTPAFGELTYQKISPGVVGVLSRVFAQGNVLIVGSSLADAPLVEGLIASVPKAAEGGYRRLAVLPLQGAEWRDDAQVSGRNEGLWALNQERLRALGIQGVFPDYYGQVGQFIYEAADALHADVGAVELAQEDHLQRYDNRVEDWWAYWRTTENVASRSFHRDILDAILVPVRNDLKAGGDEGIKIEVWARRDPNSQGKLGIWAATSGALEPKFAHSDIIGLASRYVAVQTFCAGSPQLHERIQGSRWENYYALPVWNYSLRGSFVVGVVVIASMPDTSGRNTASSIALANIKRVHRAADRVADAAEMILNYRVPEDSRAKFLTSLRSPTDQIPAELLDGLQGILDGEIVYDA